MISVSLWRGDSTYVNHILICSWN